VPIARSHPARCHRQCAPARPATEVALRAAPRQAVTWRAGGPSTVWSRIRATQIRCSSDPTVVSHPPLGAATPEAHENGRRLQVAEADGGLPASRRDLALVSFSIHHAEEAPRLKPSSRFADGSVLRGRSPNSA